MQVLSQSAFLQALGYAIAGSLWQAALLWLIVAGVNSVFKIPSQAKYKIALAAQFGAFMWFLVSLQFYYSKCAEAIAALRNSGLTSANAFILQPGTHSFSSTLLAAISKGEKLLPYLSIAYICLLAVLAIRWINGYRQTTLIKTQGLQKIDVQWRLFVQRISEMLAIKHPVKIYVSELVKSPLTVGFLKPLILIPLASINNLTTYQLEAVILHELAHIKRADYIINIIQSIIEISLFFNPFIQLLGKTIKRERENSCDDWVLQFQYDPSTYAEALLRIAYLQQTPAFAMNAVGKENDLLWRVKRMLNQKEKRFEYRNRLLALLLITGVLSSVAWFTPGIKQGSAAMAAKTSKAIVIEPLAVKVDNPLFNPLAFMNKPMKEEVSRAAEDAGLDLATATKAITAHAMAKVAPVLENIKAVDASMLPDVAAKAGEAVNLAFNSSDVNGALKNITSSVDNQDSAAMLKLTNYALAPLKNVNWVKVGEEAKKATQQAVKELSAKNVWAQLSADKLGVTKGQLNDIINRSIDYATQSVSQWNVKNGDWVDDNNAGEQAAPAAAKKPAVKAGAVQRVQFMNQQQRMQYIEQRKKDSALRKAYTITLLQKQRNHKGLGDLANDVALQYNGSNYSYSTPAAYSYTPAKYTVGTTAPAGYTTTTNGYNTILSNGSSVSIGAGGKCTLVAVKEDSTDVNSHKKKLVIETMDEKGERHAVQVVVEVYQ